MPPLRATNSAGYEAPVGLAADAVLLRVAATTLEALLVRRADPPDAGAWSLPGGFVGAGEDPADTVRRKVREKTGVDCGWLQQLGTYAAPGRDPRGWLPSIAHVAVIPAGTAGADAPAPDAAWHAAAAPPALAFDHAAILADGVARLQRDLWRGAAARGLVPEPFTLGELRRAYEAVLGRELDAPNFARTVTRQGLVEPTSDLARDGRRGRPGRRYRFAGDADDR